MALTGSGGTAEVTRLIQEYGEGFAAACREGRAKPSKDPRTAANDAARTSTFARMDIEADEAASFLRTVRADVMYVKSTGRFWAPAARRSSRNLHLVGRSGTGVALHTEYLIQVGAFGELVLDHGWPLHELDFECGPFDVEAGSDRICLAVEAKARVLPKTGDTLTALRDALLARAADPSLALSANHRNKWDRLVELCRSGPVWLWLVADGARWSFLAKLDAAGLLVIEETAEPPTRRAVVKHAGGD